MKKLDLMGEIFGKLTVTQCVMVNKVRSWKCQCACGNETIVSTSQLNNGLKKSCGCLDNKIDWLGHRFGKLLVIEFSGYGLSSRPQWKCKCDCGNEIIAYTRYLTRGTVRHCGCDEQDNKGRRGVYGNSVKNYIISSYKSGAKRKGLDFKLSNDDMTLLFAGNCYYCGAKPENIATKKRLYGQFKYNGIDRLNPENGYTSDNVVSCCQICNYMKNRHTKEKFLSIIKNIAYNLEL